MVCCHVAHIYIGLLYGIELSVPKRKLFFIGYGYENAYFYVPHKSLFQFFFFALFIGFMYIQQGSHPYVQQQWL